MFNEATHKKNLVCCQASYIKLIINDIHFLFYSRKHQTIQVEVQVEENNNYYYTIDNSAIGSIVPSNLLCI